jgi:hypothetical protein
MQIPLTDFLLNQYGKDKFEEMLLPDSKIFNDWVQRYSNISSNKFILNECFILPKALKMFYK